MASVQNISTIEAALTELRGFLGDRVSAAEAVREHHSHGESTHAPGLPDLVCFPRSNEEVSRIVQASAHYGLAVVPFGAGTSLEGHVHALRGGISINMQQMNRVLRVSVDDMDVTVEAGVTRKQLQKALENTGLTFFIDPGADATLGGTMGQQVKERHMRAVVITEPGEPEVMQWLDVPDPSPGPGEVVIDVAASGVNRADLMQRQGFYPPPPGAPPYPGLECSGRVRAVGEQVTSWRPGDEVCALLAGGGYAEQVAVPAGQLLPVPAHVDITTAAAFPETACTVYANVFQVAGLAAGEMLLVHGGTSGIGTMAIQLAKAFGARVACTAGTPEKLARCRELGADVAINYRTEDFVAAVQEATGGAGADVILDIMGASYLARNLAALAVNGRLVVIGRQGGSRAELDLGVLQVKRASLYATTLRARPPHEKAAVVQAVREHVWPLIDAGQVEAVVDRELPMSQAAQAHRALAASDHVGKILLLPT